MVGFIIGFILGAIPTVWFIKENRKRKKRENEIVIPRFIRRGIMTKEYSVSRQGVKVYDVEVQFEIGELESTGNMSKIEVVSCIANQSSSNDEKSRKEFTEMLDKSWVNSDEINWITTLASKRNDKIDNILND